MKSVGICKDAIAQYWIPENKRASVETLWQKYSDKVYPYDHLELGIRTNYFLELLKNEVLKYPNLIFINIGAGFTSYQYLIEHNITTIELDSKDIINAKKNRVESLVARGEIKKKLTHYIECDLSVDEDRLKAFEKINAIVADSPTFILCEGLFYYLSISNVEELIKDINQIQKTKNALAFDYWTPSLKNKVFYQSMIDFYKVEMGVQEQGITLFHIDDLNLIDYTIEERTDVYEQEKKVINEFILNENKDQCLDENYIILRKN